VTEEEAKTKWCPMARAVMPTTGGAASSYGVAAKCIGSACMAWRTRWERLETAAENPPSEGTGWVKDGLSYGAGGAVTHRQRWKRADGFCGLAGAPQ
jgi:hypothetical protein